MTDFSEKTGKDALGLTINKLSQIVYSKPPLPTNAAKDISQPNVGTVADGSPAVSSSTEVLKQNTDNIVHAAIRNNEKMSSISSNPTSLESGKSQNSPQVERMTVVPVLIVPKVSAGEAMKPLNDANDGTMYQCTMCEYKSHNKHYLKQHVDLVHVSNRPFKCPFCDYAGKRSQALKEHLVVHSNESPFSCDICSASFRKKGHLTSHVRLHQNVRTFECNICHSEFSKRKLLYTHLRDCHPSQNIFACDVCEYTTTIKSNIIMHMHTHTNPKKYQCSQCDFKAMHVNLLNQHMKLHNKIPPNDCQLQVLMLKCTECGFSTDSQDILRNHMWSHLKNESNDLSKQPNAKSSIDKTRAVPSCQETSPKSKPSAANKSVSSPIQLPVIYKSDNAVTTYKCSECSFCSEEAYPFITHMLSHKPRVPKTVNKPLNSENSSFVFDTEQQVFRCLICGYACEHQRTIKSHIWKHSGHKKIEYPMFQNGPISLYDSDEEEEEDDDDDDDVVKTPLKSLVANGSENCNKNAVDTSAVLASYSTLTSNSMEAVSQNHQYVLLNPHQPTFLPGRILKTPSQSSASSIGSTAEKRSCEESESFSKRFCKEGGKNVIVETLNDIYTTPKFVFSYSNNSSPRAFDSPAPPSEVSAEACPVSRPTPSSTQTQESKTETVITVSTEVKSEVEKDVKQTDVVSQESQDVAPVGGDNNVPASQEEAITLLSLLKKGPNFNPACPTVIPGAPKLELPNKKRKRVVSKPEEGVTGNGDDKAESISSDGSKSKSGICSSLLAVIEQLRERSTSESENDERNSRSGLSNSSRRSGPKSPHHDNSWLAEYPNVEKVTENGEDLFRCKLCHYTNISRALMKQHMVVHKSKQPFECSLCDFMADCSEDLQDHMIQHCKARTYQCKTCMANFSYKSQLRAHIRIAHMVQPMNMSPDVFMCDESECDFVGSKFSELKAHSIYVHGASKSDSSDTKSDSGSVGKGGKEKPFSCDRCDYVCFSSTRMKQHQGIHEDGPIKCDQCDFTALSSRSLKSHMKRHMNDQRYVQQPLEQYKCGLCGYVCHHLPSLKSHMWRHAGDNNYQYEVTNNAINAAIDYEVGTRACSDPQSSKEDANGEPEEKSLVRFRCCQCGYETKDKTVLHEHMLQHVNLSGNVDTAPVKKDD